MTADTTRTTRPSWGRRHPLALISFGVLLYSTGAVFAAAADATGPTFSFWRLWMGVVVFTVATTIATRLGRSEWPPLGSAIGRRSWRYAAWAGVWFGGQQLAFFTAVQATSVADVMLMNTLVPVLVGLVAVKLFGERPGVAFRLWTLVAISGAMVIVVGATAGPDGNPAGMALAVVNVVCFTGFFLVSKRSRPVIAVLPFLLGTIVVSALTVSTYVLVTGENITVVTGRDLLFTAIIALGPGALGHIVMTWPLQWVPANVPPLLRLAQPAIASLLAFWILGQPITVAHLTGGTITLIGVGGAMLGAGGRRLRSDTPADVPGDGARAVAARSGRVPQRGRAPRRSR